MADDTGNSHVHAPVARPHIKYAPIPTPAKKTKPPVTHNDVCLTSARPPMSAAAARASWMAAAM